MAAIFNFTYLLVLFSILNITLGGVFADERKVYIVYMGSLPKNQYSPSAHHESILEQVLENSLPSESLVRSYRKSFNGFAARLTDSERQKLNGIEGIVSVFPSKKIELQTTRSWDFIGLRKNVKRIPKVESDVIVGVLDSGITPELESFSDEGFGPPPKKWKGVCKGGKDFTCNNKLIGARYYPLFGEEEDASAIDTEGHGTHTSSTAAGTEVKNVSFYGVANGNARGAVPSARIAVYKVCWENGCADDAILSAFDDAISDGVDLLSVSLGSNTPQEFSSDTIAIGAFHAMQKGILTSHSAGNNGPSPFSTTSLAPWLLSVAASSSDRRIVSKVILGDGTELVGNVVNGFDLKEKRFPLIYGGDAASSFCDSASAAECSQGCLNSTLVGGKIVFCVAGTGSRGQEPLDVKAAGVILQDQRHADYAFVYPLPASTLNARDSKTVFSYINTTEKPKATILKSEGLKDSSAPVVVSFSSRGPNLLIRDILKPDVTAPGVDIIAGWSPTSSPSGVLGDTRSVKYNVISGTSMSCPHVTGAAAYVKTFHPDWSPSAIKSALMTTAFPLKATRNPDAEFAYGAGHIDPVKAVNPGLVYEALEGDYIKLLCSIGYTDDQVKLIAGDKNGCPKNSKVSAKDLNYPSLASNATESSFTRTVTNVGVANSTYKATVTSPSNLEVIVTPKVLSFKSLNEKKSFVVSTKSNGSDRVLSASLVWSDGIHNVRSPIVVRRSV